MVVWSGGEEWDDCYLVFNRNGHLLVDRKGSVFRAYIDDKIEDFTGHFRFVSRIDLNEWQAHWGKPIPDELDISDVAYWYKSPETNEEVYQPADSEWRFEAAEWERRNAEESPK